ncbi:MAG TPA: TauD/TfdA family dioxygenase [Candidatus Methylomirabilis sp.]|nr:TauD/TfdA family dioxygenase [Candidatus Methylomirabilis sp.]
MSVTMARPILGPASWRGEDLRRTTDWIRPISIAEADQLDAALRTVERRGLDWSRMTRDDFPIPHLAGFLTEVRRDLEDGRGLVLLRRLPVERYTEAELRIIYWGLGLHLGTPRHQNGAGELIGDVRDENRLYGSVQEVDPAAIGEPRTSRSKARSAGPLRFHTDRVDVVTLLCVRPAARGGLSKVVSAIAVHNAILERRPDLHALLCQPYYHSREGEVGGKQRYYAMPIFGMRDGRFTSQYSRTFVENAQHIPGVPPLTATQNEALDLWAEVCEELCYEMKFEAGDLQLLNNHVVYHARTTYEDDPAPGRDRFLMRLWLSMPNSRALPDGYDALWGDIEAGALRGGIAQPVGGGA